MMKLKIYLFLFFAYLLFNSCAGYQDHYTLTETIKTKVMVQNVISKTSTPFSENVLIVNNLQQQLQKMQIYESTKTKNTLMQNMWHLLNNKQSSLQKLLALWEQQGTMSTAFSEEYTVQINHMLDLMIDYESKKNKKTESALLQLLNTSL